LLDGMRGMAAIMVVLYHFFSNLEFRLFGTSVLAVDFFFMLSGFVIAHSYEQKFHQGFKFKKFMSLRVIRLTPMIIFGAAIGLFNYEMLYLYENKSFDIRGINDFFLTIFMIPKSLFVSGSMFPLNGVLWSLFFEYIAYILFAVVLFRLSNKWLALVCVIAFGLMVHWSSSAFGENAPIYDKPGFIDGFSRVIFSFPMGMLICRLSKKISFSSPLLFSVLFAFLLLFLSLPREVLPYYFYIITYSILAPAVIFLGSKVQLDGGYKKIAEFLGDVSYPLYQIHFQLLWLSIKGLKLFFHTNNELLMAGIWVIPILVGISYYVLKIYDIPFRNYLKNNYLQLRLKEKPISVS
jgi:peptidoglycan/LPS O-acetylase OafA/YrhL